MNSTNKLLTPLLNGLYGDWMTEANKNICDLVKRILNSVDSEKLPLSFVLGKTLKTEIEWVSDSPNLYRMTTAMDNNPLMAIEFHVDELGEIHVISTTHYDPNAHATTFNGLIKASLARVTEDIASVKS